MRNIRRFTYLELHVNLITTKRDARLVLNSLTLQCVNVQREEKNMSKYNAEHDEIKRSRLKDLVRRYKATEKEIEPLENYKKMLSSEIQDVMTDLDIKEFQEIKLVEEVTTLVNIGELVERFPSVVPFALAEINFQKTLSRMYSGHIDYGVAKGLLNKAIKKTTFSEVRHVKIKN